MNLQAATSVHRLHEGFAAIISTMPLQRLPREAIVRGLQQNATRSIAARLFHASAAVQADDQVECKVNGEPVHVPKGSTVMQACDAAGIDIPRQGLTPGPDCDLQQCWDLCFTSGSIAGFATIRNCQSQATAECALLRYADWQLTLKHAYNTTYVVQATSGLKRLTPVVIVGYKESKACGLMCYASRTRNGHQD